MSDIPSSAGPIALGYLYQVRLALFLLLRRRLQPNATVAIEQLDDVTFEKNGEPLELLQAKHHIRAPASLTDASPDIWKTLRIWSEHVASRRIILPGVALNLVTTGVAPSESAAWYLRPGPNRNPQRASERLEAASLTSRQVVNQAGIGAFSNLSSDDRQRLVASIYVLDQSPGIVDLQTEIQGELCFATRPEHLAGLCERVEGWWLSRVIRHMMGGSSESISFREVQSIISSVAESLRPNALPTNFPKIRNLDAPSDCEESTFTKQLRLIALSDKRMRFAISDYVKARRLRSHWVRAQLVFVDELADYDDMLREEWARRFEAMIDGLPLPSAEDDLIAGGMQVYEWMELEARLTIRPDCTEPYVMRGSFHILADEVKPRLGWHPEFRDRLAATPRFPPEASA